MKQPDEGLASAREWLRYAQTDLRAAVALLDLPEQELTVCFHAQQAAEKALKAYLAWLSEEEIPKTHDLELLADLAVQRGGAEAPSSSLEELADYAIMPRCPGSRTLTREDASPAAQHAETVIDFVRGEIGMDADDQE
jgi:HEPN domain-containing protein